MRDDVVQLNSALLDPLNEIVDVSLHRCLTEPELYTFIEYLAERKLVWNAVYADDTDKAAAANRADAIFQGFGAADLGTPDIAELVSDVAIEFPFQQHQRKHPRRVHL